MIGLMVGTSEGKNIISKLNEFTDDLFISTATKYGAELLECYKYKILNSSPLDLDKLIKVIKENNINIFVDASHPYALEASKNLFKACKECNIKYARYERPSVIDKYNYYQKLIKVNNYEELYDYIKNIKGNILNTTGSKNISKIINLNLENRIIHRILPAKKGINECIDLGIKIEDIIAIKGPISYELNSAFIDEFNAKAILMKDSGVEGGTVEKIKAAIDKNIYALVIKRQELKLDNVFNNIDDLVKYIKNNCY